MSPGKEKYAYIFSKVTFVADCMSRIGLHNQTLYSQECSSGSKKVEENIFFLLVLVQYIRKTSSFTALYSGHQTE